VSDVAIIFGGPSPEHDVSVLTGLQAARELAGTHSVRALYWSTAGEWFEVSPELEAAAFAEGVPRNAAPVHLVAGPGGGFVTEGRLGRRRSLDIGVAVICCHGGPGEDGALQGALDLAGVAYTGPTVAGAALGMDKLAFAGVAEAAGLPVLPRVLLRPGTERLDFDGPYIVKPRFGGSSIGVEIVADLTTARAQLAVNRHWATGAVVEPYRADFFDVQLAVRTWPAPELSAIERPLRTARAGGLAGEPAILRYADKYAGGEGMASAPRELPARIPDELAASLREAARALVDLGLVRGVARVDFLTDGRSWVLNEVNTVPGSLARYLWVDPVVPFRKLLEDLVEEATARPARTYSSEGADGTVLRGAASIAAKLA